MKIEEGKENILGTPAMIAALPPFFSVGSPRPRPRPRQLLQGGASSTALCRLVASNCIIHFAAHNFRSHFCGLELWAFGKPKSKAPWKNVLERENRSLETQGKDEIPEHFETASPSEREATKDMQMLKVKDTISSNPQDTDSSMCNDQPAKYKAFGSLREASSSLLDASGSSSEDLTGRTSFLCVAVVGATGDLARNKVFPALFALYYSGFLPENVGVFGYSRKELTDEDMRSLIAERLTCRVDHHENCGNKLEAFLNRTYHINGGYNNEVGMAKLNSRMQQVEGNCKANRIFYLSVPQEALLDVSSALADNAQTKRGWNRIIIEKPFGFNLASSQQQTRQLLSKFVENQIYRIDHLLGKNLIENLTVLRFSNLVFEPLWGRTYIRNVQVILSEECGTETRGRYFDGYGIIRDIVHSHIFQTIALFAMEPPVSLDGEDIRNEKVKVLRSIQKLNLEDVVLGQYKKSQLTNDPYMNSSTPTFFAAALYIDNARWDGVPFLIKTGVGLSKHRVEIRIQFRHVPGNLYRDRIGHNIDLATNELILRDQPGEAILLKVNNKVPGLGLQLDASELNMLYSDKYAKRYNVEVPDSYEHLLMDVIDGDSHLFMRSDELEAAWNILTPVLHEIDHNRISPEFYEIGSRGPIGAYYLGAKHGVRWADD